MRSPFWSTTLGDALLQRFWAGSPGRWFKRHFEGASADELHGYAFWGPVALAVLVTELLGTGWFGSFDEWPTISTTIGHLQDVNALWGLPVVALLGVTAFYAMAYGARQVSAEADEFVLGRGRVQLRYGWPLVYGVCLVAMVVAYAFGADRYQRGYALYGSLALFGIVVPLLLVRLKVRRAVFPTLFLTFKYLRDRFHWVAALVAAGLSMLVIHLALYPWPNLARDPASYAGVNGEAARKMAEHALRAEPLTKPNLTYSTRTRSIAEGADAWFVYFTFAAPNAKTARYEGCFVVVTEKRSIPSRECINP